MLYITLFKRMQLFFIFFCEFISTDKHYNLHFGIQQPTNSDKQNFKILF